MVQRAISAVIGLRQRTLHLGDGRLTLLGTEGYIEIRKYVDITHQEQDVVYLVNNAESSVILSPVKSVSHILAN